MELRNLFRKANRATHQKTLNDLGAYLEALTPEQRAVVAETLRMKFPQIDPTLTEPIEGDGHAEFLEPMTEGEYATFLHEDQAGWKKVYDFLLGKTPTIEEEPIKNENGDS